MIDVVIDLSHHNATPDFVKAKAAGIVGVIHKSTQGTAFVDPTYHERRQAALNAGLLWGAYHFGTGADGVEQAEHFLRATAPTTAELLVLDLEANGQGPSMSLAEAHAFITHVSDTAGRFPGVYTGHYIKELLGPARDPILVKCWLWLSQYGSTPVVPPTWKHWTMWQYTDGASGVGPEPVPGVGRCDRDRFNGPAPRLRMLWGVPQA